MKSSSLKMASRFGLAVLGAAVAACFASQGWAWSAAVGGLVSGMWLGVAIDKLAGGGE